MLPVCQQRAQHRDEGQRLIEHEVMMRLRDLDYRGSAVEEFVHVVTDVGGDEAELRADQRHPTLDAGQELAGRAGGDVEKDRRSNFHVHPFSTRPTEVPAM